MPGKVVDTPTVEVRMDGTEYVIPERYTITKSVGQGAYGHVCSAKDSKSAEDVAVKKIERCFDQLVLAKRILRELRILRYLVHENLLDIRQIFIPGEKESFDEIYVVSELMETDLATVLKSTQPLSADHCEFLVYQILRGMKYVHSAEVIHRDLKPRNILLNANCDLKICDFGLAKIRVDGWDQHMTEYVMTRWYRAPEVLCCFETGYGKPADMWSIGCIYTEMLTRKVPFPGRDTVNMLQLIVSTLGRPTEAVIARSPHAKCREILLGGKAFEGSSFDGLMQIFEDDKGKGAVADLEKAGTLQEAVAFIERFQRFDPNERPTAEGGLRDKFMKKLHEEDEEPSFVGSLDASQFEFERRKIDAKAVREELVIECLEYYPELRAGYKTDHDLKAYRLLEPQEKLVP